jgi:hypothetical protein
MSPTRRALIWALVVAPLLAVFCLHPLALGQAGPDLQSEHSSSLLDTDLEPEPEDREEDDLFAQGPPTRPARVATILTTADESGAIESSERDKRKKRPPRHS